MSDTRRTLRRLAAVVVSTSIVVLGWPALPAHAAGQVTSIASASITEGNSGTSPMTFTITYTGGAAAETVNWATSDGTATAPADYTASSGTAVLPAGGCMCTTISVPVVGDTLDENNETFTVTLSGVTVGTLGTATATGTINDNDPTPSLSFNNVSQAEGNSGTTNEAFTVTLSAASGRTVSANYATTAGTATSGTDFTSTSGSLSFTPGQTTKTVNVPVIGDTTFEANETYTIRLSGAVNAGYGTRTGTGTILNDDAAPVISVNNVSKAEGNAGSSNDTFTVSLSNASYQTVSVAYATANGTATAGSDYTAASGTLTFTAGQTSKTVNVSVQGDTLSEADETFSFNLSAPTNATIGTGTGTGTILNDDAAPSLSISDVTTTEGNVGTTNAIFTVSLSAASGQTVTVDWATHDVTATAGLDYAAGSGTVSFAPGQTSKQITVSVLGDTIDEINETYTVDLTNPVAATVADAQGVGTITDDDPPPTISVGDASVTEGNAGTVNEDFTVSLNNPSGKTVTVNWATADGTALAGSDYVGASGTVTFNPGETSKIVTVQVIGDTINEGDEMYTVNLSSPSNATIADAQGVGTITDDDPPPAISISDASVTEGNAGTVSEDFTVSLDNASGKTVTAGWTTNDGTAVAGSDYVGASGTVTFSPGQTSQTVSVLVKGDTLDEFDETYTVDLSAPSNATIVDAQGVGTIVDDDSPAAVSVGDVSQVEGNVGVTSATFTVTLNNPSGKTVSVDWTTNDGTATSGSDYLATAGTVTFAPGLTSKSVSVSLVGDSTFENDETFTVDLSNPVNVTIADAQGLGTILNDDAAPSLAVDDVSMTEGNTGSGTMTFTVTKTGPTALPASVDWTTSDATATAGSDYAAGSGTVTLTPGQTTATITVTFSGDTTFEADETFHVDLSNPSGATISDAQGVGTIVNDDPQPSISVSDASAFEGDSGTNDATFTVSLSNPSYQSISVDWATADATATAGPDYIAGNGTVTFAPGETSKTITVKVKGDTLNEFNETFSLNLSNPANASIADAQGTGTIVDDDGPVAISVGDASAPEGDAGTTPLTFTVSLDAPSGKPVSVDWVTSDGTATSGSDYASAGGTVNFPPDTLSETVSVNANGDTTYEHDETFTVDLSNPTNASIADAQGTGTIANDDPSPTLSIDDVSVGEGNTGTVAATFTVSLSGATALPAQVDWATAPGTATAGTDYVTGSGTLVFGVGQTSRTVSVQVKGDRTFEPDETFDVVLSTPTDATIATSAGVGTIRNDDRRPTRLTLAVTKSKKTLTAKGVLSGGVVPGMKVTVTLLRLKGKRYVKAGVRTVRLTKIKGGTGRYAASFKRPAKGRYAVRVLFKGDAHHLKSQRQKNLIV